MAMQVDDDDDATQQPRTAADYGIEVDFAGLDDEERSVDVQVGTAKFDAEIAKISADIERMAPNMKAIDRQALHNFAFFHANLFG